MAFAVWLNMPGLALGQPNANVTVIGWLNPFTQETAPVTALTVRTDGQLKEGKDTWDYHSARHAGPCRNAN